MAWHVLILLSGAWSTLAGCGVDKSGRLSRDGGFDFKDFEDAQELEGNGLRNGFPLTRDGDMLAGWAFWPLAANETETTDQLGHCEPYATEGSDRPELPPGSIHSSSPFKLLVCQDGPCRLVLDPASSSGLSSDSKASATIKYEGNEQEVEFGNEARVVDDILVADGEPLEVSLNDAWFSPASASFRLVPEHWAFTTRNQCQERHDDAIARIEKAVGTQKYDYLIESKLCRPKGTQSEELWFQGTVGLRREPVLERLKERNPDRATRVSSISFDDSINRVARVEFYALRNTDSIWNVASALPLRIELRGGTGTAADANVIFKRKAEPTELQMEKPLGHEPLLPSIAIRNARAESELIRRGIEIGYTLQLTPASWKAPVDSDTPWGRCPE